REEAREEGQGHATTVTRYAATSTTRNNSRPTDAAPDRRQADRLNRGVGSGRETLHDGWREECERAGPAGGHKPGVTETKMWGAQTFRSPHSRPSTCMTR